MLPESLPVIENKQNIAILGGAFNPVTKGHIQIAEYLLKTLKNLSEVWIMPCYSHVYHKKLVSPEHRLEMCRLAIGPRTDIMLFDYETKKQFSMGTYYLLVDLLNEDFIKKQFRIHMIIGMDNANTFHYWIQHKKLMDLIPFITLPRRGIEAVPEIDWYKKPPHVFLDSKEAIMEVSSTEVRALIKEQDYESAGKLVHPEVLEYIRMHQLYAG